jgi:dTDP-4-amino-4,6-dideoxygalactose transaminase
MDIQTTLSVPFVDLRRANDPVRERVLAEIAELIESGRFINGPPVDAFEADFSAYCGTRHCVALASGLDALRLALLAAGIESGDEVIVPAQTFVATFEAVTQAGGRPTIVDVDERDYGIDVRQVEEACGTGARFVLPVHLYGQMVDVRALADLAQRRGIAVVEDACQAHGAERDGRRAGTVSIAAAFSFYPGKNLGAFGDAGALVTDDSELAARVRALREHGQTDKYVHAYEGYTARMDALQALVLRAKLPLLDGLNEERRAAARFYSEALEGVGDLRLPQVAPGSEPVWHLYVVRTNAPEALADFLSRRGVATARHYPEPPHLTGAYAHLGLGAGSFPVAEVLAREGLSLPIFPGISELQLEAVADGVRAFFGGG